jgi:hypothetical protein
LSTESVSNFGGGDYLIWTISGSVQITISNQGALNAVLSGLFFDPPTSSQSQTLIVTGQGSAPQDGAIGATSQVTTDQIGALDFTFNTDSSPASVPGRST